jgi:hypothetical protein
MSMTMAERLLNRAWKIVSARAQLIEKAQNDGIMPRVRSPGALGTCWDRRANRITLSLLICSERKSKYITNNRRPAQVVIDAKRRVNVALIAMNRRRPHPALGSQQAASPK